MTAFDGFLQQRHRPAHARRTVDSHAAFMKEHLRTGMALLDLGCGPGSITAGLAALVGDGLTVGVDASPMPPPIGVSTLGCDAYRLPFADASFDAVFSCAMLQHVADPRAVLVEARRVCRPGAVIGVADADWDGALLAPTNPLLDKAAAIRSALREGTSPRVGKHLRGLLHAAGFERATAWVRVPPVAPNTAGIAQFEAAFFRAPAVIDHVVSVGLADAAEMTAIADAWLAWGDDPGAFQAGFWCEAIAFVGRE